MAAKGGEQVNQLVQAGVPEPMAQDYVNQHYIQQYQAIGNAISGVGNALVSYDANRRGVRPSLSPTPGGITGGARTNPLDDLLKLQQLKALQEKTGQQHALDQAYYGQYSPQAGGTPYVSPDPVMAGPTTTNPAQNAINNQVVAPAGVPLTGPSMISQAPAAMQPFLKALPAQTGASAVVNSMMAQQKAKEALQNAITLKQTSGPPVPGKDIPLRPDVMKQHLDIARAKSDAGLARAEALVDYRNKSLQGQLAPDVLQSMAGQYLAGDKSVLTGLGYGNQGASNRAALRTEIANQAKARGMSPADIANTMAEYQGYTAGQRSIGTYVANVDYAAKEAEKTIPMAVDRSNAVDRTKYPTLNAVENAVRKGTGDAAVVRFNAANQALVNLYARAMNPRGVASDASKRDAHDALSIAFSKGQYAAAADQIRQELKIMQTAGPAVRAQMREDLLNKAKSGTLGEQKSGSSSASNQSELDRLKAEAARRGLQLQ